jgi:hypothetical protein
MKVVIAALGFSEDAAPHTNSQLRDGTQGDTIT